MRRSDNKNILRFVVLVMLSAAGSAHADSENNVNNFPSIDDPAARQFIGQGLAYATALYGEPRIPVNQVYLRYKLPQAFTNLTDAQNGIFTIVLSRKPEEYAFYGLLAHEIAHLLNAQLYDVYVEGLNTVFAEKMLKRNGKDWSGWEAYYQKNEDPFYAATYLMMKEVSAVAGDSAMHALLAYAKYERKDPQRMYIDINEWINSLPVAKRDSIKKVILKHAPDVKRSMGSATQISDFMLPE